jgi:2-polyprenyl-3-methyl-5-hydroxy-6-metoxy-1,4-benzoquinol methylase
MSDEAKKWWEANGERYQAAARIPIDVLYGPGSPNEAELGLIGSVDRKCVLEVGCGGAQASIAFAKQGAIVTAVDVAESELQVAARLAEEHAVQITFHQRSMEDLSPIRSNTQDVVFSACAISYVDDAMACFREVYRVLNGGGVFVLSGGHPFAHCVDSDDLRLSRSYFDTGKSVAGEETGVPFASVHRTLSEYFTLLTDAGFRVDRLVEPDSRHRYACDPWWGLWDATPERLKAIPGTFIFRSWKDAK